MAPRQDDGLAADQYRAGRGAARRRRATTTTSSARGRGRDASRGTTSGYWARRAYTGIGAGAHSYDGAAERSWNSRDLDEYLARAEAGSARWRAARALDEATRAFEAIALGLRRVDGVEPARLRRRVRRRSARPVRRCGRPTARPRDLLRSRRPAAPHADGPAVRLGRAAWPSCRRAAGLMLFRPATLRGDRRRHGDPRLSPMGSAARAAPAAASGRPSVSIAFDAVEPVDARGPDRAGRPCRRVSLGSTSCWRSSTAGRAARSTASTFALAGPDPRVALRDVAAGRPTSCARSRDASSASIEPAATGPWTRGDAARRSTTGQACGPATLPPPLGRERAAVQARRPQAQGARPDREPAPGLPPLAARARRPRRARAEHGSAAPAR